MRVFWDTNLFVYRAITIEHARERPDAPAFSFEQIPG